MTRFAITILLILMLIPSSTVAEPSDSPLDKAHAWVLEFIVQSAPPGRKIYYPEGQETKEEAMERYHAVAWDVLELAYAPETTPVFSSADHGRSQTAAVWLGIMLHESGFTKNVDYNLGAYGRGDGGLSWCMMQLRIGSGTTVPWNLKEDRQPYWGDDPEDIFQGYTGPELIEDRKKCIGEAHHLVRTSFKTCSSLPILERLTAYAVGKCKANPEDPKDVENVRQGKAKSRARMSSAVKYFAQTSKSRGFTDQEVVRELEMRTQMRLASLGN